MRIVKLFGIWMLILLFFAILGEVGLRLFTSKPILPEYELKNGIGLWRKPNQLISYSKSCISVKDIPINTFGMIGEEPKMQKKKIALFGDSVFEGLQVSTDNHFSNLIRKSLGKETLNFALQGTGPTSYLLALRHFHPHFQFDTAIVGLFLGNDVINSSLPFETYVNGNRRGYLPHFVKTDSGFQLDTNYANFSGNKILKKSRLLSKLNEVRHRRKKQKWAKKKAEGKMPMSYEHYRDSLNDEWKEAYSMLEHSLLEIRNFCLENNIHLTLALLPSINDLLKEEEGLEKHKGYWREMNLGGAQKRLLQFCKTENINCLDVISFAQQRSQKQNLEYPYFSFPCDGHYSEKGHKMLADAIVKHLSQPKGDSISLSSTSLD